MDKEIINKSIDYIIQNLEHDMTVKEIAEHFHFSEYYFQRRFKAVTGNSVYEFIKRLKMDQSAIDIKLMKDRSITDVGLDYGYSVSNYSSAFKKHHKVSPAEFRKEMHVKKMTNPFYPEGKALFDTYEAYHDCIKILELEDQPVIYERVIGNYVELKEKWPQFVSKYQDLINENTLFIERFYDDPAIANQNSCIYELCMTIEADCKLENKTVIAGGKYAIYHYEGLICDIFASVQGVFSVWLPSSGYAMDKRYALNIYSEIDEKSDAVCMDLCIPIKQGRNSEVL